MKKTPTKMNPPSSFTKYEAAYFRKLVTACKSLELLEEKDFQLFELAAKAAGEYQVARAAFMEHGPTIITEGDRGGKISKANPASTVMSQASTRLAGLLKDLGLGPASRAKMKGPQNTGNKLGDPIGDLLNS